MSCPLYRFINFFTIYIYATLKNVNFSEKREKNSILDLFFKINLEVFVKR